MSDRQILIDVSRLVWRCWRGGLPTGVDRVCLAYVEHFAGRAQAVVQRRGRYFILRPDHSDELFALFSRRNGFQRSLLNLVLRAFPSARSRTETKGLFYLNVGHTGLDHESLVPWIRDNGLRAVFLIHDLIPVIHPEYCRSGEEAKHQRRIRNALMGAHGIIANSRATFEDVASFANAQGMSMPPSVVAWIAGPPIPTSRKATTFDRPHFIVVGTIEGRKNHLLLFHIWRRLFDICEARTPLLVMVGQRGWEADQTFAMLDRASGLANCVLELSNCNDEELAKLTVGARALLMPSFAEGFGLPVAEALQLGTPVIASNLSVFREFAAEIPTYIDPLDGVGWARAITEFTGGSPDRDRQLEAMRGYRAPDWHNHFKIVEDWLVSIST